MYHEQTPRSSFEETGDVGFDPWDGEAVARPLHLGQEPTGASPHVEEEDETVDSLGSEAVDGDIGGAREDLVLRNGHWFHVFEMGGEAMTWPAGVPLPDYCSREDETPVMHEAGPGEDTAMLAGTFPPPVRCVDSVLDERIARRQLDPSLFHLCRLYSRSAHGCVPGGPKEARPH